MEAGRELDALIVKKVMGWRFSQSAFEQVEPSAWSFGGKTVWCGDFRPSTEIAAAWQVVEKVNLFSNWSLARMGSKWEVGWVDSDGSWETEAASISAPHAICLAALKAVGA